MFPIIDIGPLALQAPGFILILSLFIGLWLTGIFSKNIGTNGERIENSLIIALIAGLVAARLGFILQNLSIFIENPTSVFSLTPSLLDPGFGVFVGIITAIIYAQKKHLPLWPSLDTLTPIIIMLFAGLHLAAYAKGDNYGLPTNLPWGIELWNETRHPVQIYSLLFSLLTLIGVFIYTKRFRRTGFSHSGILISLSTAILGFITVLTRAFIAEKNLLGNFDLGQIIGFMVMLLSISIIYFKQYHKQNHIAVLLSLGSNQNPVENLSRAVERIKKEFKSHRISSVYKTKDIKEGKDSPSFFNQVAEIDVNIPYIELRTRLKSIEKDFGRKTGDKKNVPLDLDILTYNKDVFHHDSKQIPDPNLIKYSYIAIPLAELTPDFRHPANGNTINEILATLKDKNTVHKMNEVDNELEE